MHFFDNQLARNKVQEENKPSKYRIDNLFFTLDEEKQTACLVAIANEYKDVFIPRSIKYKSKEYIITNVQLGFKERINEVKSLQFAYDSVIKKIGNSSFWWSSLVTLVIPPSVIEFESDWLEELTGLNNLVIMPNNPRYKNFNDKLVVGKCDIKNEEFDFLVFVSRDVQSIEIPSNIKIIGPYAFTGSQIERIFISPHITKISKGAFSNCINLKKVEIPPDTELKNIGKDAFTESGIESFFISPHLTVLKEHTFSDCESLTNVEIPSNSQLQTIKRSAFNFASIESLVIPSTVTDLQDGWCSGTVYLKKVTISPKNKNYIIVDEKMILGKSNPNNVDFDVLHFVIRDVLLKNVKIPSFVKIIGTSAFERCIINSFTIPSQVTEICEIAFFWCVDLYQIEFEENSNLKKIGSESFQYSSIEKILIPSSVVQICECAFSECESLRCVSIPYDSKLQEIGSSAFYLTSITCIFIPSTVKEISKDAFDKCFHLKIIELGDNSQLKSEVFLECYYITIIIMIPVAQ